MSTLSTHVLDTTTGEPARGMVVRLERAGEARPPGAGPDTGAGGRPDAGDGGQGAGSGSGAEIGRGTTDGDGRIADFGTVLAAGTYRLVFETGPYLERTVPAGTAFFPEVAVTFTADGRRPRYHVPLLLSPYSYSTYRGS